MRIGDQIWKRLTVSISKETRCAAKAGRDSRPHRRRRSAAVLSAIVLGIVSVLGVSCGETAPAHSHEVSASPGAAMPGMHSGVFMPGSAGEVDIAANGFDPMEFLSDFDYGRVSKLPDGRTLREWDIEARIQMVEIMPGIRFEAWTYNGRVPGPTLRATEGDVMRIHFTNATPHPHTMHFHTIHPANMDGVYEPVPPGGAFTYEFDAAPFGVHPYHCHIMPLASHISRGLYGAVVIDPKQGRPKADKELVIVMAGNDIDFDNENDAYNVNFIPFYYDRHPIKIKKNELVRIYLVNMLEFDQSNSFHIHANFFNYYPNGTRLEPSEYGDTISQMQAQRGIVEFSYKYPGKYMFHAHKTEFAELGWTGVFDVEE